jgi:hypothetical protein
MSPIVRYGPWWALLVVPGVFLGSLSAAYAVAPLACMTQRHGIVHIAPAIALLVALSGVALAGLSWRRLQRAGDRADRRFLAGIAAAVAALFVLAALAQWYVAAALSPCL